MVRGRVLVALLAVVAVLASGCILHPDGSRGNANDPVLIVLVGDSLTGLYGPIFETVGRRHGAGVQAHWQNNTSPLDAPWHEWVTQGWSDVDYVILEDWHVLSEGQTQEQYLAAWQQLVDAARSILRTDHGGGRVYVLDEIEHPDLSGLTGVDGFLLTLAPDHPDGIHWLPNRAANQAHLVCEQLSVGDAAPECPR